jgi:hypothetical protein
MSACRPTRFRILLLCAAVLPVPWAQARCDLPEQTPEMRAQWRASGFPAADAADRIRRAHLLVDCLGDPDPRLRDGIAYEALSKWMRDKQFDPAALRSLQARLFKQLEASDTSGFRRPFAALALSEVARTDRAQPWMSVMERDRMTEAAASYLSSVRDYRGYVDGEGWRHGVAHGADWAMQLILNKAMSPAQRMALLSSIGSQVMPAEGHAYAFGESARLARPVVYAVARDGLEQSAIDEWLLGLEATLGPMPEGEVQAVWWIRRANLETFLNALASLSSEDPSPRFAALAGTARRIVAKLP